MFFSTFLIYITNSIFSFIPDIPVTTSKLQSTTSNGSTTTKPVTTTSKQRSSTGHTVPGPGPGSGAQVPVSQGGSTGRSFAAALRSLAQQAGPATDGQGGAAESHRNTGMLKILIFIYNTTVLSIISIV